MLKNKVFKNVTSLLLTIVTLFSLFGFTYNYEEYENFDMNDDDVIIIEGDNNLGYTQEPYAKDSYFSSKKISDEEIKSLKEALYQDFYFDEELQAFINEKTCLSDAYVEALSSGNTELAEELLNEFIIFSTNGDQNLQSVKTKYSSDVKNENDGFFSSEIQPELTPASLYSSSDCCRCLSVRPYSQKENYYCGPATAQMILNYKNVYCSQKNLAGDKNLNTEAKKSTPWFTGYKNSQAGVRKYYPMAIVLSKHSGFYYTPYCNTPNCTMTESGLMRKVFSTINTNNALAACIQSVYRSQKPHIQGYPNRKIRHWVCISGYASASSVEIVDPAYGLNGFTLSSPKYIVSSNMLSSLVNNNGFSRGLIW